MPESLRIWRWLSALALMAVGLVMGASVAGAQTQWPESGHALASSPAQFHTSPGHFVTPLEPHVAGSSYAAQSTNWSGQIATGTTYSAVRADWVVPTVQPTQYSGASATWIGIDGGPASPGSIIQTGTVQLTGAGATSYAAWYELYPAAPVTVGGVSPGDTMTASISHDNGSNWTVNIADTTTGGSDSQQVTYTGPGDSAEWIEELPTAVGTAQPTLANFGSATFSGMTLTAASPGDSFLSPIDMVDESGNVIASAGPTTSNGFSGSFTDSYVRACVATGSSDPTAGSSRSVKPSSMVRRGACTCSDPWWASCPQLTTVDTGSTPQTAGSSATATRSSTAPYPASGCIRPARAYRTASTRP